MLVPNKKEDPDSGRDSGYTKTVVSVSGSRWALVYTKTVVNIFFDTLPSMPSTTLPSLSTRSISRPLEHEYSFSLHSTPNASRRTICSPAFLSRLCQRTKSRFKDFLDRTADADYFAFVEEFTNFPSQISFCNFQRLIVSKDPLALSLFLFLSLSFFSLSLCRCGTAQRARCADGSSRNRIGAG
jgi:hypothetical protein